MAELAHFHKTGTKQDCLACAPAQPSLGPIPFLLDPNIDPTGYYSCLKLLNLLETVPPCTTCYPQWLWFIHPAFPCMLAITPASTEMEIGRTWENGHGVMSL